MKKHAIYFILFSYFLFPTMIISQTKFEKKVFSTDCDELLYNILVPNSFSSKVNSIKLDSAKCDTEKYPLVLFLHGAGERGNDNTLQITSIKKMFENRINQNKYPCFVIAPQCPKGEQWVDVDWSEKSHNVLEEASCAMLNTVDLLNHIIENYPIDTTRIYVTGLSMGGYGTWDIISRYPNLFAAAVPICGGGDENMAKKIKNIPIWAFHGAIDNVVPVVRSRNMIKAIKKAGGHPKYTEYKGVKHGSWIKAYKEKTLLAWMFSNKR